MGFAVITIGFQNCSKAKFTSGDVASFKSLEGGAGISPDTGEVLVPGPSDVPGSPAGTPSVYVCPPGTKTSGASQFPIGQNGSYASGTTYGTGPQSSSTTASSGPDGNHATVTQTGTHNIACVVQVGPKNTSVVDQTGQTNQVGVKQTGGQDSKISQNGVQSTGAGNGSPESCGCELVVCDSQASAAEQKYCQDAANQNIL